MIAALRDHLDCGSAAEAQLPITEAMRLRDLISPGVSTPHLGCAK